MRPCVPSSSGVQPCVLASACSSIPGSGRRGRAFRWGPHRGPFTTNNPAVFTQGYESWIPWSACSFSWKCRPVQSKVPRPVQGQHLLDDCQRHPLRGASASPIKEPPHSPTAASADPRSRESRLLGVPVNRPSTARTITPWTFMARSTAAHGYEALSMGASSFPKPLAYPMLRRSGPIIGHEQRTVQMLPTV